MENTIITIARQYGASGRYTGEILSARTGIKCYAHELITMAAERSELDAGVVKHYDEKSQSSLLYTLAVGSVEYGAVPVTYNMPISDKLFIVQSNLIRELADKGPCILVGRCADYVLRDYKNKVSVFLQADIAVRAERVAKRHNVSIDEAHSMCLKTDKKRAAYYSHYTGQKWGRPDLYDLVIDTTEIEASGAANVINAFCESLK